MNNRFLVIFALVVCLPAACLAAGSYDCRGVIANGAAHSANPYYSLSGAVGQNAVGLMSGYYICGAGFWPQSGGVYAGLPAALDPIPTKFWLGGSEPNPVRQSGVLRFGLPRASQVTIRVYDVRGREVATLVDGTLGPGYHAATVKGTELASGVYFCRMDADRFSATHKLLVIK
ncbi:MAG TPA: T9SS type A sorting domain-containing protein [bacterium]|nr:T9SS type A sorting domain-containing protein [bacterium]